MQDIYRFIDEHMSEYVERFQTYLRFPSVAAQNRGQEACASWFRDQLIQVGLSAHLEATDGAPVVVGEYQQPGAVESYIGHSAINKKT